MAKWIEYDYVCNEELGILAHKKVEHNEANLAIAQAEAYNGEYIITEDDEATEVEPLAIEHGGTGAKTATQARENLGALSNEAGAVKATHIAKGAVSQTLTGTLLANGWTDGGSYAVQTITVSGLLSTDAVIVDAMVYALTLEGKIAVDEAWGNVYFVSVQNNALQVYSTVVPDMDIPIKMVVIRK